MNLYQVCEKKVFLNQRKASEKFKRLLQILSFNKSIVQAFLLFFY